MTLRSSPGIEAPAGEFFAPLDERLTALVTAHDPAQLDGLLAFLSRLNADLADVLGTPSPRSSPNRGWTATELRPADPASLAWTRLGAEAAPAHGTPPAGDPPR